MSRRRREKAAINKIALERIEILLSRADKIYKSDPVLAQRYGALARKIVMKARIQMPSKWRLRFCSKCKNFLYPGINARVRVKSGQHTRVVYYCEFCNTKARSKVIEKA